MEELEISARTVEEAIHLALERLGIGRDEVEISVLKEGKAGVFGLGGEEATIRVRPLVSAAVESDQITEMAKGVLETLLEKLGVSGSVVPQTQPVVEGGEQVSAPISFDIRGEDLGILIGRRGQTLASLQYVARLITAQRIKQWVPIIVDVGGYKQRRYSSLRVLALRVAEQVKIKKVPFRLEPMPANERRIIHLALADHPDVNTESIGESEARRVVVSLKADSASSKR